MLVAVTPGTLALGVVEALADVATRPVTASPMPIVATTTGVRIRLRRVEDIRISL